MQTENTVGGRIKKQNSEVFEMLQNIINRPGMYVGKNRFDYVDFLLGGYRMGLKSSINFFPSEELQYWLLHTQSASIDGSINGKSLFYRCFGFREMAFENYKIFLDVDIPENSGGVYDELWDYRETHNIIDYCYIEKNIYKDLYEGDLPEDYYQKLAQAVIDIIKEIINSANFSYDKLKVYIRKDGLFNQVRFIFCSNNEWVDDSEIIAKPENHEKLIAMHTIAKSTSAEALRDCGCYVLDTLSYDNNVLPCGDMFTDDITFYTEFLNWKSEIIAK